MHRSNKDVKAKLFESQKKCKLAEEREQRISQSLKPKLQQAIEHQKSLFTNYNQIKEDTELLPMIFRAEAAVRTQALEAQAKAEIDAKEAVDKMQTLLQKISNLEKDKAKAMQLSMKAIAARSNIKQYLDDEKARNIAMQEQMQIMGYKIKEADAERNEYANKHDEMFNSVSALNQRIEELENHKLHLLNKLKGYGDKGGLEYIVKTQNLD